MGKRIEHLKRLKKNKGLLYIFYMFAVGPFLAIWLLIGWFIKELGEWMIWAGGKL